jgi:hypothetical protein
MDFILNGQGHGSIGSKLVAANMDPRVLRPYVDENGRACITVNQGGKEKKLFTNATATLRKDEWLALDRAVMGVAKERLRVFGDLRSAGSSYSIPNGMGTTVFESQRMGDITDARFSMDGLAGSDNDRLEFDLVGLPLPIVHKQFRLSARQLATSRNGGAPLDTMQAEAATRRCAEQIEKLTLGIGNTYAYGGYTVYGYRNFPQRLTQTLTSPATGGWTPAVLVNELLAMKQKSVDAHYFGPWQAYFAPAWSIYLDDDYSPAKGDNTLRQRLAQIEGISGIATADYLTGYDIILVQRSSDVARAVIGMEFTTVQWEEMGGLALNFMVMGIMVPQLRADINDNTGIVHGAV